MNSLRVLVLCLLMPLFVLAEDLSIKTFQDNGQLEIKTWLSVEPQESAVINEQVILFIELGTSRWFTGGTQIQAFSVDQLIVPFQQLLSTNFTENIKGQTWSRQRWEIRLFPQATGEYTLPQIAVTVQVSAETGRNISRVLYSQPPTFTVKQPKQAMPKQWFAASSVDVKQQWQSSHQPLQAGDSITRTITIQAKDSLSMLIDSPISPTNNEHYQRYTDSPSLQDKQERGEYTAKRKDKETYLLQTGGEFILPALTISWWNTATKQLESITLSKKKFQVKHTFSSIFKTYRATFIISIIIILLFTVSGFSLAKYYRQHPLPEWLRFRWLLKKKRWSEARTLLYKKLHNNHHLLMLSSFKSTTQWKEQSELIQSNNVNANVLKHTWKQIKHNIGLRLQLKKSLPELHKRFPDKK